MNAVLFKLPNNGNRDTIFEVAGCRKGDQDLEILKRRCKSECNKHRANKRATLSLLQVFTPGQRPDPGMTACTATGGLDPLSAAKCC